MATGTGSKLFGMCSILMSCLFAYSASVQLNDPDWYLWFPLYACACFVNLVNWAISPNTRIRYAAKVALLLGTFLLIKVGIEELASGRAGLCSLDLTERLVREKIGSGLVVASMVLHLEAASPPRHHKHRRSNYIGIGMAVLTGFSYGLPFIFFVVGNGEIKL